MNRPILLSALLLLAAFASAGEPALYEKYHPIFDEDEMTAAFITKYGEAMLAVCYVSGGGDYSPTLLPNSEGQPIELSATGILAQGDVQILRIKNTEKKPASLTYQSDFKLAPGEELVLLLPDRTVGGKLAPAGLTQDGYSSGNGPTKLEFAAEQAIKESAVGGLPVVLKKTGMVVGVLLPREKVQATAPLYFETLCLGGPHAAAPLKVTLEKAIEALRDKMPKSANWEVDTVAVEPDRYSLIYMFAPEAQRKELAKQTRNVTGLSGHGGAKNDQTCALVITELTEEKLAGSLPDRMSSGYRDWCKGLAGLVTIKSLDTQPVKVVEADAANLTKAKGTERDGTAFTNTVIRAARGRYYLELSVKNLTVNDDDLIQLAGDSLAAAVASKPRRADE